MLHKILILVSFVSLECVTAAASNEYNVSREKRAFPAAPNLRCTYDRMAMRDVVAILKTVTETYAFSATESANIVQRYTRKYSSGDECDSLIRSILANCKDIIDLRKNGKTEELEAKLKNLQINLDSVDRRALQREETLRQSFNNIQEAMKLEHRQLELKKKQAEKNHEQAVLKLVSRHLQTGDVDIAVAEFSALTNRDALARELVQMAHSDSKVQLLHLAQFASKVNFYTTAYFTIYALYQEMQKHGQLEEKEMILLYYRLKYLVENEPFSSNTQDLKSKYHKLKGDFSPYIIKIVTSLISQIKLKDFVRSVEVVEMARTISNGEQFFLTVLMQNYLQSTSLDQFPQSFYTFLMQNYLQSTSLDQFPQLFEFVTSSLSYWSSRCWACNIMWHELKASGNSGTMKALAVWNYASEVTKLRKISDANCKEVADETAPAYYDSLKDYYKYYIQLGNTGEIRNLHETYKLNYFFREYIKTLSLTELQDDNFNKIYNAINNLPFKDDSCSAASTVYEIFKPTTMIGTYEHFLTLKVAKEMLSGTIMADEFTKSQCQSVKENSPEVFRTLLFEDTSKCRLINRHHGGALYCTSRHHQYWSGYRPIYVWSISKYDDQYWNLSISADGLSMRNNYHSAYNLRYLDGYVQGSYEELDKNHDFFRVHDKDGYLLLEPTTAKVYVAAGDEICKADRRCVEMINDSFNKRAHWKLECS